MALPLKAFLQASRLAPTDRQTDRQTDTQTMSDIPVTDHATSISVISVATSCI